MEKMEPLPSGNKPIYFAVPGAKKYFNRFYSNHPHSFVHVSITGGSCALQCAHCGARLLNDMIPMDTPENLVRLIDGMAARSSKGILISGGADHRGKVPLLPFCDAMAHAHSKGMKVIVHSGLLDRQTACALRDAGVDQVLMDIIGDRATISQVYHLDARPENYLQAMMTCREVGLKIAPHVVIGLYYGRTQGEIRAIEMIKEVNPDIMVLVVLTPVKGTEMERVSPPAPGEIEKVIATAVEYLPDTPINLGCARPAGIIKRNIEKIAVDYRLNAIAYPDATTVEYSLQEGLEPVFVEECCSLLVGPRGDCE